MTTGKPKPVRNESVTDADQGLRSQDASRNTRLERIVQEEAARYAELTAEAETGDGYANAVIAVRGNASIERHARWLMSKDACKEAGFCGECGEDIAPGEVVWRRRTWRFGLMVLCGACLDKSDQRWRELGVPSLSQHVRQACEGCGRPVAYDGWRHRPHPACSERCRARAAVARRRERRTKARTGLACERCGEVFTPPRADGLYCSSACRQAAYRERKAKAASGLT